MKRMGVWSAALLSLAFGHLIWPERVDVTMVFFVVAAAGLLVWAGPMKRAGDVLSERTGHETYDPRVLESEADAEAEDRRALEAQSAVEPDELRRIERLAMVRRIDRLAAKVGEHESKLESIDAALRRLLT